MTGILSRNAPTFDITAASFQGAARDVGEVVAYLAGGIRPDPDMLSRLCVSMRALQGFLIEEADQQASREAVAMAVAAIDPTAPIPVYRKIPLDFELVGIPHGQQIKSATA